MTARIVTHIRRRPQRFDALELTRGQTFLHADADVSRELFDRLGSAPIQGQLWSRLAPTKKESPVTNDKAAATYHPQAKRPTTDGTNRIGRNTWPQAPVEPVRHRKAPEVDPLTRRDWVGILLAGIAATFIGWGFLVVIAAAFGA